MKREDFVINQHATLSESLQLINNNKHGFVLGCEDSGKIVGIATDGDIRRKLLDGRTLQDELLTCLNEDFVWANETTSRETLLKCLDHRIRAIPVLDDRGGLVDIVTRENLPIQIEEPVYVRSRAPARISFGGGGSDITYYFSDNGGAVISATINLYSHATLKKRDDARVRILSRDLNCSLEAENLNAALKSPGKFGLILAIVRLVSPTFGFDLYLNSDFPVGSGLGGSAVVTAAVLGCFNQFRQDKWNNYELAELAFQAERMNFDIAGGWQDQYATVFGGFNFMEFKMDQNLIHPLRIDPATLRELEECLIICDTNMPHDSGKIHKDQKTTILKSDGSQAVMKNVEMTYRLRNDLLRGRLLDFGRNLNSIWQLKRQFSNKITNPTLDEIYNYALENGAEGGKLMGAGGGGFFMFYVNPFNKYGLVEALESRGLGVRNFQFDNDGLQSWVVRATEKD
jgi:D-glycero-alpha-D-manno-heptose-7-phosphate kinase